MSEVRGNWPAVKRTPEERDAEYRAHASECAKRWREDCYVYVLKGNDKGIIEYHPGPDPDRPRTKPDLVVPYHKPEKVVKRSGVAG